MKPLILKDVIFDTDYQNTNKNTEDIKFDKCKSDFNIKISNSVSNIEIKDCQFKGTINIYIAAENGYIPTIKIVDSTINRLKVHTVSLDKLSVYNSEVSYIILDIKELKVVTIHNSSIVSLSMTEVTTPIQSYKIQDSVCDTIDIPNVTFLGISLLGSNIRTTNVSKHIYDSFTENMKISFFQKDIDILSLKILRDFILMVYTAYRDKNLFIESDAALYYYRNLNMIIKFRLSKGLQKIPYLFSYIVTGCILGWGLRTRNAILLLFTIIAIFSLIYTPSIGFCKGLNVSIERFFLISSKSYDQLDIHLISTRIPSLEYIESGIGVIFIAYLSSIIIRKVIR